jgi:DNA excision repair protein ERCC-1
VGQYLATYKRFEHKPPNMIKERVEREPTAIMRAALTSISKVNKTDFETLRTTFGVRSLCDQRVFAAHTIT